VPNLICVAIGCLVCFECNVDTQFDTPDFI
jgi:hypothetical protein